MAKSFGERVELKPPFGRLFGQALAHWRGLRGDRPMPAFVDLDPEQLRRLGPQSLILQLGAPDGRGQRLHVVHMGSQIPERFENLSDAGAFAAPPALAELVARAMSEAHPICGVVTMTEGETVSLIEWLAAPLAAADGSVEGLWCVARFGDEQAAKAPDLLGFMRDHGMAAS